MLKSEDIVVAAMYKFVSLPDYRELREPLLEVCRGLGTMGTLLLAEEGINGTVAGTREQIDGLLEYLRSDPRLVDIDHKESLDSSQPFYRMKVKLKKEIVTMGVQGIDPLRTVGTYVAPKDWNALLDDPEVVLIDTRNEYEFELGTFEGAVNPHTDSFREFPDYVSRELDPQKHKKVAMFCTGGIRCEKSTAFLKEQGFDEVFHLQGGILKYLEEVPETDTKWQGECFVFDNRVAVNHKLEKGRHEQCFACRMPITEEDMRSEYYDEGVSCPRCYKTTDDERKARFAERRKQIELAKARGEEHIGSLAPQLPRKRI